MFFVISYVRLWFIIGRISEDSKFFFDKKIQFVRILPEKMDKEHLKISNNFSIIFFFLKKTTKFQFYEKWTKNLAFKKKA